MTKKNTRQIMPYYLMMVWSVFMVAPRYGIAEWYGRDITTLTHEERKLYSQLNGYGEENSIPLTIPECPFLSTLILNYKCNKRGGVCSIRKFNTDDGILGYIVQDDKIVTVCPSRFLQTMTNQLSVFEWISEKILDVTHPLIVKETPFLRKVNDSNNENVELDSETEVDDDKKAGRIDWILVNPETSDIGEMEWCAIETQSLYFSGDKMSLEFKAYADTPSSVLFPVGKRRPDYRSSGPKRLSPQLDVKVPVLRTWGKKVAVVIDKFFYDNMSKLDDAYSRAKNDRERRDNADVIWLVVDYDENLQLKPSLIKFTTLESSRTALNATEPLSKADFTHNLREVIHDSSKTNKVFKV